MSIAVLAVTDGRDDCLGQTISALENNTQGAPIVDRFLYDDTGRPEHRDKLSAWYPEYEVLSAGSRQGFGGALRFAWAHLAMHSAARYVLAVEDDLVIQRPLDLAAMCDLLAGHPYMAQVALTRQPWNADERRAGGVVASRADTYTDCVDEATGAAYLSHRNFWTTNISVYRRQLCEPGWPGGPQSEGRYTHHLLRVGLPWGPSGDEVRFAYWGRRDDPPWTEHIGEIRAGHGY